MENHGYCPSCKKNTIPPLKPLTTGVICQNKECRAVFEVLTTHGHRRDPLAIAFARIGTYNPENDTIEKT